MNTPRPGGSAWHAIACAIAAQTADRTNEQSTCKGALFILAGPGQKRERNGPEVA